jgi:hypothetical protein
MANMLKCFYCQFYVEASPTGALADTKSTTAKVLITRACKKPEKEREINPNSEACDLFKRGKFFFCDANCQRLAYEVCAPRRERMDQNCNKCSQWPFVEEACLENPLEKRDRQLIARNKKKTIPIQIAEPVQTTTPEPAIRLKKRMVPEPAKRILKRRAQ